MTKECGLCNALHLQYIPGEHRFYEGVGDISLPLLLIMCKDCCTRIPAEIEPCSLIPAEGIRTLLK